MKILDVSRKRALEDYACSARLEGTAKAELWHRIEASVDAEAGEDRTLPPRARRSVLIAAACICAALAIWFRWWTDSRQSEIGAETEPAYPSMASREVEQASPSAASERRLPTLPSSKVESTPELSSVTPDPPDEPRSPSTPTAKRPLPRSSVAVATRLGQEMALLREARSALEASRLREALAWLDRHAREFPDGQLRDDRQALQVVALCRSGRSSEGRHLLQTLSAQAAGREQLQALCAERPLGTDSPRNDE
jgi:type IV secretory pathway VirB10-like protein